MSSDLDDMYVGLMNNQLPPIWEKVSFATMKTLGSWMKDALSSEAKTAEAITEASKLIEHLPILINNMGEGVTTLASEGLKLHPDTLSAMSKNKTSITWPWWAGTLIALGLIFSAI